VPQDRVDGLLQTQKKKKLLNGFTLHIFGLHDLRSILSPFGAKKVFGDIYILGIVDKMSSKNFEVICLRNARGYKSEHGAQIG
jgi:hypothetical protein